jgi:hypothetical protein
MKDIREIMKTASKSEIRAYQDKVRSTWPSGKTMLYEHGKCPGNCIPLSIHHDTHYCFAHLSLALAKYGKN